MYIYPLKIKNIVLYCIVLRNFHQLSFPEFDVNINLKTINPFKDFQSDQYQRSSLKVAHYAYRNAHAWERLTHSFFQIINSVIESFWGKLDLPWLLTFRILYAFSFIYVQCRPIQTDASATGTENIGGLNFSCLFERAEIRIPVNKYECPQTLSFSPANLF